MKKVLTLMIVGTIAFVWSGASIAADLDQAAAVKDQKVDESKRTDDPVAATGNATYDGTQEVVKGTGKAVGVLYKAGKSVVTGKNQFREERERIAAHPDMEPDDAARTDDPVAAVGNAAQTGSRNVVKGTKWSLGHVFKFFKSAVTGHNEWKNEEMRSNKRK